MDDCLHLAVTVDPDCCFATADQRLLRKLASAVNSGIAIGSLLAVKRRNSSTGGGA